MGNQVSIAKTVAPAENKITFDTWSEMPPDLQRYVLQQLDLFDAARAACTSRGIADNVKQDPRWAALTPSSADAQSAFKQASNAIHRAAIGPNSRAAIKALLTTPLRPLAELCAASDVYSTAYLTDWKQQTEPGFIRFHDNTHNRVYRLDIFARVIPTLPERISHLAALQEIDLYRCKGFTSLVGFSHLPALQGLSVAKCYDLTSFEGLAPSPALQWLKADYCRGVTSLSSLGHLPALNWLNLSCSGVRYLTGIERLPALNWLNLSCSEVRSLTGIEHLPALRELDLYYCPAPLAPDTEALLSGQGCRILRQRPFPWWGLFLGFFGF